MILKMTCPSGRAFEPCIGALPFQFPLISYSLLYYSLLCSPLLLSTLLYSPLLPSNLISYSLLDYSPLLSLTRLPNSSIITITPSCLRQAGWTVIEPRLFLLEVYDKIKTIDVTTVRHIITCNNSFSRELIPPLPHFCLKGAALIK